MKKQTIVAVKQHQKFDNAFESNKNEEDKSKNKRSRAKSNKVYNNYHTFYRCNNIKEFTKRPLDSKLNDLKDFKNKLKLFYYDNIEIKQNNEDEIKDLKQRKIIFNTALELYNKLLNIHKPQYDKLTKAKKKRIKVNNVSENLTIKLYLDEDDLPPVPPVEDDEKVKLEPEETITERIKLYPLKQN